MKQFKTLLLAVIVTFGFSTIAQAQSKVAHINTQELISLMPETKALNSDLEKLGKTYESEIQAETAKFQATLKKYDGEAKSQTAEENQKRAAEMQQAEQKLYQSAQVAKEDIDTKRNEQLRPILDKARKAIEDVAAEQGYEYVLDASSLIVAKGKDLLEDVKVKLGI